MQSPDPVPQTFSYGGEVQRKGLHLLALVMPAIAVIIGREAALAILVPLTATAFLFDWLRVRSASVNRMIDTVFGSMMRPVERPRVGDPLVVNGATWVVASVTLLIAVFPMHIAVPAFAVFMIGDAAAALIGRKWGRHPIPGAGGCTLEGSMAFLTFGFLVGAAFVYPWNPDGMPTLPWMVLAAGVLAACGLEAVRLPINDNILAPFGAAAVMTGLMMLV